MRKDLRHWFAHAVCAHTANHAYALTTLQSPQEAMLRLGCQTLLQQRSVCVPQPRVTQAEWAMMQGLAPDP